MEWMLVLSLVLTALVALAAINEISRTNAKTIEEYRRIADLSYHRVSDLENRMFSKNTQEYAGLQYVPDSVDRTNGEKEEEVVPESYGVNQQDTLEHWMESQGSLLDNMGPTVG